MASLMYEIGKAYPKTELYVIAGITAASSGAAVLGAPLNHDFCVISLSDLLTPWEAIEKGYMQPQKVILSLYCIIRPAIKRKNYLMRACDILLCSMEGERVCGYVENIGRDGTKWKSVP